MGELAGNVALVTGASRGLGYAIATEMWAQGASLFLVARSRDIHSAASTFIPTRPSQTVLSLAMDVGNPDEWPVLLEYVNKTFGTIDIAVCNAGIYGPFGRTEDVPWDDWQAAITTNLLGTVLTCRATVPYMRRQGRGKIVVVSGGGATQPLPRMSAYATSKAAVVRFAETLAVELRGSGIDVNSVAPGSLNTRMLDQVLEAGPERTGRTFYAKALEQKEKGGASITEAAQLVTFLASDACDGISGRLISAVWDDWRKLPEQRIYANSDRYTLRRVT